MKGDDTHAFVSAAFGLDDHSTAALAVHDYQQGRFQSEMTDAAMYFEGGLRGEPLPVDKSLSGIAVDRKITDLEGDEILEEVTALRWRHSQVA